jgi:hypothetical protein
MSSFDKTLKDKNRREINLREYQIESVLPSFFLSEYPKLVSFLKKYYEYETRDESISEFINDLFEVRDINQVDLDLLQWFEDDFLLGQNYFEGFFDKRTAVKYSSFLYRSKGTRYSIRQFFKTFFNIEPDVVYTKQYVFTLNDSKIGAESARYLTDDKLYQTYALQIRSELSVAQWRDAYKLLVHPAGMYLGGLTQIVGTASFDQLQYDPGEALKPPIVLEGIAGITPLGFEQNTALFDFGVRSNPENDTGAVIKFRTTLGSASSYPNPGGNDLNDVGDLTIANLDGLYSSLGEYLTVDSPTLDDDADFFSDSDGIRSEFDQGASHVGFDISSTETIDQERFSWNPQVSRIDSDNLAFSTPVGDSDSEISLREVIDRSY